MPITLCHLLPVPMLSCIPTHCSHECGLPTWQPQDEERRVRARYRAGTHARVAACSRVLVDPPRQGNPADWMRLRQA